VLLKHVSIWWLPVGLVLRLAKAEESLEVSPRMQYLGHTPPVDTPADLCPDLLTEPGTIAEGSHRVPRDGRESITCRLTGGAFWHTWKDQDLSVATAIGAPVPNGVTGARCFLYPWRRTTGSFILRTTESETCWRSPRTKRVDYTDVAYEEALSGMYGFTPTKERNLLYLK